MKLEHVLNNLSITKFLMQGVHIIFTYHFLHFAKERGSGESYTQILSLISNALYFVNSTGFADLCL